jgi:hypothetical protein
MASARAGEEHCDAAQLRRLWSDAELPHEDKTLDTSSTSSSSSDSVKLYWDGSSFW